MADQKQLTTRQSSLWWLTQPGGTLYLLDCIDLESIAETENAIELLRCWNGDRSGWDVIGETVAPAEKISLSVAFPRFLARSILESGSNCPGALIWTQTSCGRVDDWSSADIGEIIQHVRMTGRSFAGVAHRETDNPTNVTITLDAWPPLLDIDKLDIARVATTEAQSLNDVFGNLDVSCGDCGAVKTLGQYLAIACDAAGGATGNVQFSTDVGETFAAGAADPFGVGFHTMAGVLVPYNNGRRWIVGREGTGAVQGQVAYSDNAGTTWTVVSIGGAAVGHGATFGHGIFALDSSHVWLASADGYIYKSVDAGVSWVAKEAGVIHANDNHFVHFADKSYGLVGGAAGVISITSDGGESWLAGGIPAASPARCGWRFNDKVCLVGLDNGAVYRSTDGGLTWTLQVTGFPAGAIRSMWFVNDYQGFLVHNTAAPVGTLYKTNNGGTSWQALTTPTNVGLNSVWAPSAALAFVVGEAQGGTGFIAKVVASYV